MHLVADVRAACAALPGTIETFPFDSRNLTFKVGGEDPNGGRPLWRMYAMVDITEDPLRLLVKCEPGRSSLLRERYPQVVPALYFGGHWVFLPLDGTLPEEMVRELLVHSYDLVVGKNLPRRMRARLASRSGAVQFLLEHATATAPIHTAKLILSGDSRPGG